MYNNIGEVINDFGSFRRPPSDTSPATVELMIRLEPHKQCARASNTFRKGVWQFTRSRISCSARASFRHSKTETRLFAHCVHNNNYNNSIWWWGWNKTPDGSTINDGRRTWRKGVRRVYVPLCINLCKRLFNYRVLNRNRSRDILKRGNFADITLVGPFKLVRRKYNTH
jgi:hypothetical protein